MRILVHSLPIIALAAILASSMRQKIELSILSGRDAGVLPETTSILLQSNVELQRKAGARQRTAQLREAQPNQIRF